MSSNRRRQYLIAAVALALPLAGLIQAQGKIHRIGILAPRSRSTPSNPNVYYDVIVQGLRELGYIEGKNLVIEWRFADAKYERLPRLAAELVKSNVEVIVAVTTPAALALQRATSTIPIVAVSVSDPVKTGLVTNLARPEGNITGLSNITSDTSPKLVQFLKDMIPAVSRVAALVNPSNAATSNTFKKIQSAAIQRGIEIVPVSASTPEEIERGFSTMTREHAEAVIVVTDSFFLGQRSQIAVLAVTNRLPSASAIREEALAGALISYGPDLLDTFRRAPIFVDKILRGTKPGELPFEQPTRLELVVNLKTARQLGITIPPSILLRADEVIQ